MTKPRLNEPLPEFTRATLKKRLVNLLDQFPRELELGTFRTEHLLVRLGHMLRELSTHLDKTRAEEIIYGKDDLTLRELGDAYWELGVAIETNRPRNTRRKPHADTMRELERSSL